VADRVPNPYRPGFNQPPLVMAGRDLVLEAAQEALDGAALDGVTPRPVILVGSRGVGKTVLLGEIADRAGREHGWPHVHVEVRPDRRFSPQLVARLTDLGRLVQSSPRRRAGRFRLDSAKVSARVQGVGAEATFARAEETAPDPQLALETAVRQVMEPLIERQSGMLLTVDELQLARRDELADVAAIMQEHVPDGWPLVVAVAGLPTMRAPRRTVTYFERGDWHDIGLLGHDDTLAALCGPAEEAGRPFDTRAVALLGEASGGYPYAIQVYGHHVWRTSAGSDRITLAHARKAAPRAEADLERSLFTSRWEDASPRERDYLRALAELTEAGVLPSPTGGDVARRLGVVSTRASYLRDRLLKKGTIAADGPSLRFAVPGMSGYIIRKDAPSR
jgi:hypothetical protein